MPVVIPLIGTAIAWGAAGGALSTLMAGGFMALNVAEAMTLVAAVGATVGTIGVVARDKNLQTAGLVMAGIGAIGGLASTAGLINGNASMFGPSEAELATQIPSSVDITPKVLGDIGTGQASTDMLDALAVQPVEVSPLGEVSVNTPAPVPNPPEEIQLAANDASMSDVGGGFGGGVPPSGDNFTKGFSRTTPKGVPIVDATQMDPVIPSETPSGPTGSDFPVDPTKLRISTNPPGVTGAPKLAEIPVGGFQGMLKDIGSFAHENQMVSYGLIQAGSSLVQGMFNPVTPAQINQLNSQAESNRANAAIMNQQLSNMQGGMPVAKLRPVASAPVTGAPAGQPPPSAPGQGMINISPSSQLVTGVPRL
jgi:hypothetical protein